jgi:hypothetical protein
MNEQIKQLMIEARLGPALLLHHWGKIDALTDSEQAELERLEKFAELIVQECTQVLFDESERLFGLYSEETNMQQAEEYEICSNQCTNDISLIEKHFGVEE